ncbi:MAG: GNAT family N-acetyltransferase [Candidatus Paceibacterota bacterium]|jgi:RimJ/RimL family protein N-acetyltransferase
MIINKIIVEKEFEFRVANKKDVDFLLGLINEPEINEYLVNPAEQPISKKQELDWIQDYINSNTSIALIVKFKNKRVGVISVDDINKKDGSASFGLIIKKDSRGMGIGKDVIKILTNKVSKKIKVKKFYSFIKKTNTRSIALVKSVGFVLNKEKSKKNLVYFEFI